MKMIKRKRERERERERPHTALYSPRKIKRESEKEMCAVCAIINIK